MNVLVVAAHPDDEALGAGATIHNLSSSGNDVYTCILSSWSPTRDDNLVDGIKRSNEILGVKDSHISEFNCMKFSQEDHHSMVRSIEESIRKFEPDVVITHSPYDIHTDHSVVFQCCMEACRLPNRQIGYDKPIKSILCMEVPSSTEWSFNPSQFSPTVYKVVNKQDLKAKFDAISVYDGVVRKYPHPRSDKAIRSRSHVRGSECGFDSAEAFMNIMGVWQ